MSLQPPHGSTNSRSSLGALLHAGDMVRLAISVLSVSGVKVVREMPQCVDGTMPAPATVSHCLW